MVYKDLIYLFFISFDQSSSLPHVLKEELLYVQPVVHREVVGKVSLLLQSRTKLVETNQKGVLISSLPGMETQS